MVRTGMFETNSSSTHSCVICDASDFEKFKNGEMFLYDGELYTFDNIKEIVRSKTYASEKEIQFLDSISDSPKEHADEFREFDIFVNYSDYEDYHQQEHFTRKYTTKLGEEIVVFGYYGYDG